MVSLPVHFFICMLMFGLHQAYYISKKDRFLIAAGIVHPLDANWLAYLANYLKYRRVMYKWIVFELKWLVNGMA